MEQGPTWESNRSSTSLGILPILWSLNFHYLIQRGRPAIHCRPLHLTSRKFHFNIILIYSWLLFPVPNQVPVPLLVLYRKIPPSPCEIFRKIIFFFGEVLLAPHPTLQLKKPPWAPVHDCYSLHCQLSTISGCCSTANRGGATMWWQGLSYHGNFVYMYNCFFAANVSLYSDSSCYISLAIPDEK